MATTVILADDHPVYCDGLSEAIAADPRFDLLAVATDGRRAMELVTEHVPDVAVLDVKMPGLTGLDIAKRIARDELPTNALLLSAFDDPGVIVEAVSVGIGGYMLKDATRSAILDAIQAVSEGRLVLASEAQTAVAAGLRGTPSPRRGVLSDRELEILRLTAEGKTAAAVGAALHLSPATVKTHLRNIYEKLDVSERAAAVAVAMRMGLLR
jgi:two-component system, NarL family, nitrate/nitrite response regulator NarL